MLGIIASRDEPTNSSNSISLDQSSIISDEATRPLPNSAATTRYFAKRRICILREQSQTEVVFEVAVIMAQSWSDTLRLTCTRVVTTATAKTNMQFFKHWASR